MWIGREKKINSVCWKVTEELKFSSWIIICFTVYIFFSCIWNIVSTVLAGPFSSFKRCIVYTVLFLLLFFKHKKCCLECYVKNWYKVYSFFPNTNEKYGFHTLSEFFFVLLRMFGIHHKPNCHFLQFETTRELLFRLFRFNFFESVMSLNRMPQQQCNE